jgi:hypothetical protein
MRCLSLEFEPRFSKSNSIASLVAGNTREPKFHINATLSQHIAARPVSSGTDWNVTLAWSDFSAVSRIYSNPRTMYYDYKMILVSSGKAGSSISLRVDLRFGPSRIWLCQLISSPVVSFKY